ncbi:hypothetical protein CDL15_Pgr021174 [Punica granatum]|uniref:Uncharacterized protein n=1 Tax=Punica granatum TaxID=22663 RepID=A0A218WK25_PUNGR|nr:hypothetical protein CDL15_Pgr021174 [Punica granatum]
MLGFGSAACQSSNDDNCCTHVALAERTFMLPRSINTTVFNIPSHLQSEAEALLVFFLTLFLQRSSPSPPFSSSLSLSTQMAGNNPSRTIGNILASIDAAGTTSSRDGEDPKFPKPYEKLDQARPGKVVTWPNQISTGLRFSLHPDMVDTGLPTQLSAFALAPPPGLRPLKRHPEGAKESGAPMKRRPGNSRTTIVIRDNTSPPQNQEEKEEEKEVSFRQRSKKKKTPIIDQSTGEEMTPPALEPPSLWHHQQQQREQPPLHQPPLSTSPS